MNLVSEFFNRNSVIPENYFCHIKGIDNNEHYNDTLALFHNRLQKLENKHLLFSSTLPHLQATSPQIKLALQEEVLPLTASSSHNHLFTEAFHLTLSLAGNIEGLAEKLYMWSKEYIAPLSFGSVDAPKCLYYGALSNDESYFLILLALLGFDVVYFNPSGDSALELADTDHLAQEIVLGPISSVFVPYEERISKGSILEKVTTYAKEATKQLEETLYTGSGIYRPWQFTSGTTSPVLLDSVIEDMLTYWNEPAKLRPGFRTEEDTVYTPIFFNKISGIYKDSSSYTRLLDSLKESPLKLYLESFNITSTDFTIHSYSQNQTINYHNVNLVGMNTDFRDKDLDTLRPCLKTDNTINPEALRKHSLYPKLTGLRSETQRFIIKKINELLGNPLIFSFPLGEKENLMLIASVLNAHSDLLSLIDRYDFTSDIPKLILYLKEGVSCDTKAALLIGFLHTVGFDLIILSPSGATNIDQFFTSKYLNDIKLEEFVTNFSEAQNPKKGFFSKLFRK